MVLHSFQTPICDALSNFWGFSLGRSFQSKPNASFTALLFVERSKGTIDLSIIFLAIAFAFVFLTFFGVQYPLTFDFHIGTMAAAFIPWILWAMFKGKWKIFVLLCIIASGFKEDMPLYVAAFSLYIILTRRNWKLGSIMLVLSLGYDYVITRYLMPSFAHNAAKTFSLSYFSLRPDYLWSVFFNSPVKLQTMFISFANVLFILPLFSGFFLLLPLAHFFINFSNPDFPGRWGIFLHHRGYLSSILVYSSILGYSFFQKMKPKIFNSSKAKIILAVLLIVDAVFLDYLLHLPLNTLLKHQFYYTENWIKDNNDIVKKIPPNAYLLITNSLAPQVSFREHIYYYPQNLDKADYIFIDLHPDQPIINFWLTATTSAELNSSIKGLLAKKRYRKYYQLHDSYLLKRTRRRA